MDKTTLGNRMKQYEKTARTNLMKKNPVIIRLDGKGFSKLTKGFARPFDDVFAKAMAETAKFLCENIQGCKIAYTQSDEITLLLTDYEKITTEGWFDNQVQKMVSVSASMATLAFNKSFSDEVEKYYNEYVHNNFHGDTAEERQWAKYREKVFTALFDSRVFSIPKEEVANCFIWRQQDCTKNSISMLASAHFSHKELHKKKGSDKHDMLMLEKGVNWNDLKTTYKRGACVIKKDVEGCKRKKWVIDTEIPIFTANRDYIEQYV